MWFSTTALISLAISALLSFSDAQPLNVDCETATIIPPALSAPFVDNLALFNLNNFDDTTDPVPSCYEPMQTPASVLWYSWEPIGMGVLEFSTAGSRSGVFASRHPVTIFERPSSSSCSGLTEVACGGYGWIRGFEVEVGKHYIIQITNNFGSRPGNLVFSIYPTPPPPTNDECATATVIPSTNIFPKVVGPIDFLRATDNVNDETLSCDASGQDGLSLWYEWTPSTDGMYNFLISGTVDPFDNILPMYLGVYQGSVCTNAMEIGCVTTNFAQFNLLLHQMKIAVGLLWLTHLWGKPWEMSWFFWG